MRMMTEENMGAREPGWGEKTSKTENFDEQNVVGLRTST
jgi:hypothetical protein